MVMSSFFKARIGDYSWGFHSISPLLACCY
jgi:hypothetical protein